MRGLELRSWGLGLCVVALGLVAGDATIAGLLMNKRGQCTVEMACWCFQGWHPTRCWLGSVVVYAVKEDKSRGGGGEELIGNVLKVMCGLLQVS